MKILAIHIKKRIAQCVYHISVHQNLQLVKKNLQAQMQNAV